MEEHKILFNLQPGDRFKVNFKEQNQEYINSRFLVYKGCWMEVREKTEDSAGGPCAYYVSCLKEHNPNRADQQDFAWGSCGSKEWRPLIDFTEVRKAGVLPVEAIRKESYLPNI